MNKLKLRAKEPCLTSHKQLVSGPIQTTMLQAQALKEPNENLTIEIPKCQKTATVLQWSAGLREGAMGSEQKRALGCPWFSPMWEQCNQACLISLSYWEQCAHMNQAVAVT